MTVYFSRMLDKKNTSPYIFSLKNIFICDFFTCKQINWFKTFRKTTTMWVWNENMYIYNGFGGGDEIIFQLRNQQSKMFTLRIHRKKKDDEIVEISHALYYYYYYS